MSFGIPSRIMLTYKLSMVVKQYAEKNFDHKTRQKFRPNNKKKRSTWKYLTRIFSSSHFRVHRHAGSRRYPSCVKLVSNTCRNICRKMAVGRRSWMWKYPACRVYAIKWICWITARRWVKSFICGIFYLQKNGAVRGIST